MRVFAALGSKPNSANRTRSCASAASACSRVAHITTTSSANLTSTPCWRTFAINGEITPPCGVPVTDRRTCPSLITPARNIARSSLRTDWSLTRSCTARINSSCGIASKETSTYYWYRGLSVVGNCYARSTSVAGQAAAGVGQDAPARCGGVAGGVAGREQDVAAGGFHRCRPGGCGSGGCDGGIDGGPGSIGGGGGVVDATGGRGRRGGGRYGDSDQGGSW